MFNERKGNLSTHRSRRRDYLYRAVSQQATSVEGLSAGKTIELFPSGLGDPIRRELAQGEGNRIRTTAQNRLLGSHLSEFHSGYRVYSAAALAKIPFDRNTDQFHFDTEIIIQRGGGIKRR